MTFFARLFKTKPSLSLEQRIAALRTASEAECLRLARSSQEPLALRQAALARIESAEPLAQLLRDKPTPELTRAARQRLGALLERGAVSVETLSKLLPDTAALAAALGGSASATEAWLAAVGNEADLLDIALNAPTTQQRQAAARKIRRRVHLEQLLKSARSRDKAVYKIVQAELAPYRVADREQAERRARAEAALEQLRRAVKRGLGDASARQRSEALTILAADAAAASAQLQTEWEQLEATWRQLEKAAAAERDAALAALEQERAATERAARARERTETEFAALFTSEDSPTQAESVRHALAEWADAAPAEANAQRRFEQALHRVETVNQTRGGLAALNTELLQAAEPDGELMAAINELLGAAGLLAETAKPNIVRATEQHLAEWRAREAATREALVARSDAADKALRRAAGAVNRGQLGRASEALEEARTALAAVDPAPAKLSARLAELEEQLQKLRDYRAFATEPKKLELIERAAALAAAPVDDAEARAQAVKGLQEEWRSLSRGGPSDDETQYQTFKAHTDRAFEPVAAARAEAKAERAANLTARGELVDQLETYLREYNFAAANFDEVGKTLKLARQSWRAHWPLPRGDHSALEARFEAAAAAIAGHMEADYRKNEQRKAALVRRAEQLKDVADVREAMDKAKALQAEWKQAGRAAPKEDRALWQSFRTACDQVFARADAEREARGAATLAARERAEALTAELEAAPATAATLELAREYRAEIEQLDSLAEAERKRLFGRIERTLARIDTDLTRSREAEHLNQWRAVLATSDRLRQQRLKGEPVEIPQDLPSAVLQAFQQAPQEPAQDDSALRRLCIRAEILAGDETPTEDRALRMSYQVEQLQQGLGQRPTLSPETRAGLICEWLAQASVTDELYYPLASRFATALKLEESVAA